jgi:hypothetical protein
VAAGALIGVSADIKINYVLFGLGLAWALRRSLPLLAASAGAALAVLVPSYAAFGTPAIHALAARRNGTSADSFYNAFLIEALKRHIGLIAVVLVVAVAVLAFRRMPDGLASRPAAQAALVLSVAWLFFWPYQFPWYDTMIICLLVFYPASRLDWLVLARIAAGAIPNTPGNPGNPPGHIVAYLHHFSIRVAAPMVLLAAAVGLVLLCVYGRWKMARTDGPPGAAADGLQHDRGDHRVGRKLPVTDPLGRADRLDRHVERAGQAGRSGRRDDLIVGGPQRHPARPGGHRRGVDPGEQAAARHELLARRRAGAGHEPLGPGRERGPVERGAEGDYPARLGEPAVVTRPQQHDHAARRVADHVDRRSPRRQRPGHGRVERGGVRVQFPGAVAGQ